MPPHTDWTMEPEVRELKEWLGEDVNKLNFIDFLTGAGGRMIERLKQEANEAGKKEGATIMDVDTGGYRVYIEHGTVQVGKTVAEARLALIEELEEWAKKNWTIIGEHSREPAIYQRDLLSLLTSKEQETK